MGFYVGVQFSFSTNSLGRLREVAFKTLNDRYDFSKEDRDDFESSYTKLMLEQISEDQYGKYVHKGNKGDMFMWGGVWNYYSIESEDKFLKRFLLNCWQFEKKEESIFFDFDRALLIINREGSEMSNIYEFSYDKEKNEVNIKKAGTDLCWNQY